MSDDSPTVEITVEEPTETPTVEVEVEVETDSTSTDVAFAERITRLEMQISDKVDRTELTYIYNRIESVEQLATVNAAVTEVVAETVEEMVSEPRTEPEPPTETQAENTESEEEAPKSKRHRWWGNR
jgi:hypothetical protein